MNYTDNHNQFGNSSQFNNFSTMNNVGNMETFPIGNMGTQFGNSISPGLLNVPGLDDIPNISNPNDYISNNFDSGVQNHIPGIFNQTSNFVGANTQSDNKSLIKSLTKEIINNLKENNMSLYDNSSINSRAKNKNLLNIDEDNLGCDDETSASVEHKAKRKKNKKIKDIEETIENFVVDGEIPNKSDYAGWFFDECFNYKDFIVLFVIYFILSQEMIKDFFSKYFSSLNPDSEGKVGVQGVIIYGLILTILFMLARNLF